MPSAAMTPPNSENARHSYIKRARSLVSYKMEDLFSVSTQVQSNPLL